MKMENKKRVKVAKEGKIGRDGKRGGVWVDESEVNESGIRP